MTKIATVGYIGVAPKNGWSSNQSVSSRAAHNGNNYKCSNRYTETPKAGNYVTRSGDVGYKHEAGAASTVKVTDKVGGITTEYQTQVNVKKMVYPSAAKSYSNKRVNFY